MCRHILHNQTLNLKYCLFHVPFTVNIICFFLYKKDQPFISKNKTETNTQKQSNKYEIEEDSVHTQSQYSIKKKHLKINM